MNSVNRRIAAIDIGTNSIRGLVAEADETGGFRLLDDEKATVRLGEGLQASGRISPAAWERARSALGRMQKIAEGLGVGVIAAVATSAVRKAENGAEFIRAMQAETGIDIRVISGEEEAELAVLSARHHFSMRNTRNLLIDIGGGSVELILTTGGLVESIHSLELGAVFLSETFLHSDPASKKEVQALRHHIRGQLAAGLGELTHLPLQSMIGSGGTITSIGGMLIARSGEPYDSVNRYEVLHSDVVHLAAMLQRLSCRERRAIPGLSPERADIILAGVVLVDELMHFFGTNLLRINERGIREGLILKTFEQQRLICRRPLGDWREAVVALARACHVDLVHAEQTARIGGRLFDVLAAAHGLESRDRVLLEAAALLHDIGYFIDYSRHHKHSYHLIRHAGLFDLSPREKELIANVARYHRKSLPKKRHENFARLSPEDQQKVLKLGGILRLADGLDRRRTQQVRELAVEVRGDTVELVLAGEGELDVELHGGAAKGDLFALAFGLKLSLRQA